MQIDKRTLGDVTVVDMTGRLDTQTTGQAHDEMVAIAKSGTKKLVLNLEKLEFVSSAGLRVILTAAKLLQSSRGEMRICGAHGVVREVLESSGFNHLVKIDETESDAIAALG